MWEIGYLETQISLEKCLFDLTGGDFFGSSHPKWYLEMKVEKLNGSKLRIN